MERLIDGERRLRREYSADFKALVLRQTRERGALADWPITASCQAR